MDDPVFRAIVTDFDFGWKLVIDKLGERLQERKGFRFMLH